MGWSPDESRQQRVVGQGTPWPQRLDHAPRCPPGEHSLRALRQAVDPDDAGLFTRRLQWDGLTPESARAMLACRQGSTTDPAWVPVLRGLQNAAAAHHATPDPALADIPFERLWSPLVAHEWHLTGLDHTVSPKAAAGLRRDLARRFAQIAAHACYADFAHHRAVGKDVLLRLGVSGSARTGAYEAWCQRNLQDGLQSLLDSFPVLGRLLAVTALSWRQATCALIRRVRGHREQLADVLGVRGPLTAITTGLSDPHRGGHSVAILHFGMGKVVYKPKDLRLERGFHELVKQINAWFGDRLLGEVDVVLGDGGYGFTSFVDQRRCRTEELPTFYRGAGRLTALLHLLGATDAHYENVITRGPSVTLIDAETLLRPRLLGADDDGPLGDSVLSTGMVPNWVLTGPDQVAFDPSALGFTPVTHRGEGWLHRNTDDMVWATLPVTASSPAPDEANPLADHVESLVFGLREVLRACRTTRFQDLLLNAVTSWRGLPQRVVLRATRIYGLTLANATSAASLRDANTRAMHLERLARSSLILGQREPHWCVYRAELEDLENADVPFFDHDLGTSAVRGALGPIDGLLVGDAIGAAISRITGLDDDDLRWQEGLLRGAVLARATRLDSIQPAPSVAPARQHSAAGLLREVVDSAVPGTADPSWLTLSRLPDGRTVRLGMVGDGWYDGRVGIAAALHYGGHATLAERTAAPVLRTLTFPQPYVRWRYVRGLGLGFSGVGGILRWLRLNSDHGHLLAELIQTLPGRLVELDRARDFIGGVAGLIGPLARTVQDPEAPGWQLLERAAHHLLASQDTGGGWLGPLGERPLTGLAHGAAGNGLALLEAGTVLQRADLVDAGARAFAYEDSVYDAQRGNWPDFRDPSGSTSMTAWCHGAPGIGLARWRALQLAPAHPDAPQWRDDLVVAMTTTARDPLPGHDHLCCGLGGRAAVLRIVGRATGEAQWVAASEELTARLIRRPIRVPGSDPRNPVTSSPGLMTGLAGIAAHMIAIERDEDLLGWLL